MQNREMSKRYILSINLQSIHERSTKKYDDAESILSSAWSDYIKDKQYQKMLFV